MNHDLKFQLYAAVNENDGPREIEHWHLSSIAKCPRALLYERLGIPPLPGNEPGGGHKIRWRAGHAIEATIRPELEKIFPGLLTNVRFTSEQLDATGEFDAYHPDTKTLISVKSVSDFAFVTREGVSGLKEADGTTTNRAGKVVTKWKLKEEPYIHHQWQEHGYVLLMRDPNTYAGHVAEIGTPEPEWPWLVDQITYVYITLSGLVACYTTGVDPKLVDRVGFKLDYLNEAWKAAKAPACVCRPGEEMYDVQDQYCNYKTDDGCCDESLMDLLT